MTRIIFLGTGGGRIVVTSQIRASGGWILEMEKEKLHIDPGPGALVRAKEFGVSLKSLTGVLVSHSHPDHYTDVEMVIEAMTLQKEKKGVLICSERVIKGGDGFKPVISDYFLNKLEKYEILNPGDKTKIGQIEITATPTEHLEEKGIGFVFKGLESKIVVGYTSDGEYFKGQENWFKGCDYLILNCLRPRGDYWIKHMNTEHAKELIGKVKPKLAILTHFGMKMLKANPNIEAKWIQSQTGVETIAAKDGMVLELGAKEKEGLEKFLK